LTARALLEERRPSLLAGLTEMQEAAPTSPLQLLFIELRVGLARSTIQAGLLLNGGGAVTLLLFLATILTASGQRSHAVELLPLKWALALLGSACSLPA
jgi:hypothetical protein